MAAQCEVCGKKLRALPSGGMALSLQDAKAEIFKYGYICPECDFVGCFVCCADMATRTVICRRCKSEMGSLTTTDTPAQQGLTALCDLCAAVLPFGEGYLVPGDLTAASARRDTEQLLHVMGVEVDAASGVYLEMAHERIPSLICAKCADRLNLSYADRSEGRRDAQVWWQERADGAGRATWWQQHKTKVVPILAVLVGFGLLYKFTPVGEIYKESWRDLMGHSDTTAADAAPALSAPSRAETGPGDAFGEEPQETAAAPATVRPTQTGAEGEAPLPPPGPRVLQFPEDRTVGNIWVRDWGATSLTEWEFFAKARLTVIAPEGKEVKLVVLPEEGRNLSFLDALGPDVLAALRLRQAPVTDAELLYVKRLRSLTSLCLAGTLVTDACVPYLAELKQLEALDLSRTVVSDGGIAALEKALPACRVRK